MTYDILLGHGFFLTTLCGLCDVPTVESEETKAYRSNRSKKPGKQKTKQKSHPFVFVATVFVFFCFVVDGCKRDYAILV